MRGRVLALAVAALVFLGVTPRARGEESFTQELIRRSGADSLADALPEESQELLAQAGVEGVEDAARGGELFTVLSGLLREKLLGPLKALAALAALILLCRLAGAFGGEEISGTAAFAGTLAAAAVAAAPLLGLLDGARRAVEGAGVFLAAAAPIYGGLLAASGSPTAGSAYTAWTLAFANAIPWLSAGVVFPALRLLLALALADSASDLELGGLSKTLYGFAKWILVLAVTLFSGLLSVQTLLGAQADAAAGKALKFLAATAVPVVGGAFGDGVAAIQSSVELVRGGAGAFGILAALCVFAPPALETALWAGVCSAGEILGAWMGAGKLSRLLGQCAAAARMILGVLAATCAATVVSAATILLIRGSLAA